VEQRALAATCSGLLAARPTWTTSGYGAAHRMASCTASTRWLSTRHSRRVANSPSKRDRAGRLEVRSDLQAQWWATRAWRCRTKCD